MHHPLLWYDMKFVIFTVFIIIWDSYQSNIVTSIYYCFISEQGCHNDLISKPPRDAASDPNTNKIRPTNEICLSSPVTVISDSVHCIPLTLVPFKTFTSARLYNPSTFNAQFFGGIAFGMNVFLQCSTIYYYFNF